MARKDMEDVPAETKGFVQDHSIALRSVHSSLIELLLAPQSSAEEVAGKLHSLAMQQKTESKEFLGRVLQKGVVDVLKGGICEPPEPNTGFQTALSIVDVAIVLVSLRHVEDKLPCTLLEFVFSFCTRKQLTSGVALIRDRFVAYRNASKTTNSHYYLIKTAMSCINRDQKGSDPAFSGRLRLMLSAALPVWHISGMNKRGQYNTGNEAEYASALRETDGSDVDLALHKAFWGVQTFMRNPSLAEAVEPWAEARKAMEAVLSAFEALPCSADAPAVHNSSSPKYMTSGSILRLQLVDIRVRRHVLVQYVIFLHHLQFVAESTRTEKVSPEVIAKVNFCKSLFREGGEGEQLQLRVYKLLEKDAAGKFKKFLMSLLQRERRWMDWKKAKGYKHLDTRTNVTSKAFKRRAVLSPVPGTTGLSAKRKRTQDQGREWDTRQSSWDVEAAAKRMEILMDRERCPILTVEGLKDQLRMDIEDVEVTEDVKRKNDTKYVWRTLRMLSEESLETLAQVIDLKVKGGYDLELCLTPEKTLKLTEAATENATAQQT